MCCLATIPDSETKCEVVSLTATVPELLGIGLHLILTRAIAASLSARVATSVPKKERG